MAGRQVLALAMEVRSLHPQLHACLVVTAACFRGTEAVRVQLPEQAPRDRSVQRLARHRAKVSAPGRIWSVALAAL